MTNILALDQASQTSGWAVYNKESGVLKAYGTFTFDQQDFDTRLYRINRKVKQLIEEHNIQEVYLEDIQLQGEGGVNNTLVYKRLAEVLGVICCLLSELRIPHTVVPSATWRHTCGIGGRNRAEKKRGAQKYVMDNYGLAVTEDAADAICIGKHAILSQNPNDWSN